VSIRLMSSPGGTPAAGAVAQRAFLAAVSGSPFPSNARPSSPEAATASPRSSGETNAAFRVLIVEDNQDAASTLEDLLLLIGYEVRVAYTGSAGVKCALEFEPHVVLCDIGLPELDGYEVARRVKQHPQTAHARFIAVTGYGGEEGRARAQAVGFEHYLVKPINLELLETLLVAETAALAVETSHDDPTAGPHE
jgi:CheY-like chemotaxis protein